MTLFLSSFGFNSPIIAEKMEAQLNPTEKRVLVLPFAGFHVENTFLREKNGLLRFGFAEENIFFCDAVRLSETEAADCIYVPGGNPFKLLKYITDHRMAAKLRRLVANGTIYIGASAGAELSTPDIHYVAALEENNDCSENYEALGLCRDIVIPHSDQRSYADYECCKATAAEEHRLLLIRNDQLIRMDVDADGNENITYF